MVECHNHFAILYSKKYLKKYPPGMGYTCLGIREGNSYERTSNSNQFIKMDVFKINDDEVPHVGLHISPCRCGFCASRWRLDCCNSPHDRCWLREQVGNTGKRVQNHRCPGNVQTIKFTSMCLNLKGGGLNVVETMISFTAASVWVEFGSEIDSWHRAVWSY